jgi:hypothetical protein
MAARLHHRRSVRILYLALGLVSLGVGIVGIVVPLVPTAGPVLLAGFFFARSSERFHDWLTGHPRFGPLIADYQAGLGIPMRAKVLATVMIVASFGLTMAVAVHGIVGRSLLAATAAGILAYILTRPTKVAGVARPIDEPVA